MKAQAMLLLSFSLAACQPDPVYDFVWEGKHVTVHGFERSEADTCAGSFEALDAHSASIVEFFDYNESLHYEYKWMSQDYWEGRCRPGAGACTASGVPLTRTVPDMHEAAHAVVYASMGHTCPSLLSEGIATYLTRPRFYKDWATNPEISGELGEALTEGPLAGEHYNLAGHFVSFLVEDHGPEALMRLCELVPYYNTVADWEAASEEVLGVELEQLIEQYEQYPICSQQQYRARLWECAGQPDIQASSSGEVELDIQMDCADERTIGPIGGKMIATRRIEVPQDMRLAVYLDDEAGEPSMYDYNIQECAACSDDPDLFMSTEFTGAHDYRAGMYELILFGEPDEPEVLTLRIAPL